MKTLAIITLQKRTCDFYKKELEKLFGDIVKIEGYYFENAKINDNISADLILITSPGYFNLVRQVIKDNTKIIIMQRTFTLEGLNKLKQVPKNSTVMLVNPTLELAFEVIAQLYQLGIRYINFIPVYKGMSKVPNVDIAVTPGELRYVPKRAKKIINIKGRVLDASTIMNIIGALNLNKEKIEPIVDNYLTKIVPMSYGLQYVWNKSNELDNLLQIIISMYEKAILAVTKDGTIIKYNKLYTQMFEEDPKNLVNKNIKNIFPELNFDVIFKDATMQENILIKFNNKDIVMNIYPVSQQNISLGAILTFNEFFDVEDSHQRLKKQLIQNGHVAKYTFKDIIGESKTIKDTKKTAIKMARSNLSILIYGQSGTGKELFAQAIHNASERKDYAFVAINCSALSENLLESELFGYVEGAFTGAKKGGSIGLFELADKGTIFLDEIGEISLNLQAKLLRVLQEGEIRRVGGNKLISIDVRVIAATNKNLKELILEKKFREDLYYRLAVFPLNIPSLDERKEDIKLIIQSILKQKKYTKVIRKEVYNVLINYSWKGNIRQLQNCIEYAVHMSDDEITLNDLPTEILNGEDIHKNNNLSSEEEILINELKKDEDMVFILKCLTNSYKFNKSIGRRSILNESKHDEIFLTEQTIRKDLEILSELGITKIARGRGGTKLTQKGLKIIKGLNG